jgi:hypothetical protein
MFYKNLNKLKILLLETLRSKLMVGTNSCLPKQCGFKLNKEH